MTQAIILLASASALSSPTESTLSTPLPGLKEQAQYTKNDFLESIWEKSPAEVSKVLGKAVETEKSGQNGYDVIWNTYRISGDLKKRYPKIHSVVVTFWWKQPKPKFIAVEFEKVPRARDAFEAMGLGQAQIEGPFTDGHYYNMENNPLYRPAGWNSKLTSRKGNFGDTYWLTTEDEESKFLSDKPGHFVHHIYYYLSGFRFRNFKGMSISSEFIQSKLNASPECSVTIDFEHKKER